MGCDAVRLRLVHALGGELRLGFRQRAALHQCLGLGEAVGDQELVLVARAFS